MGECMECRVMNCAKHKRKSGIGLTAEQYGDLVRLVSSGTLRT